MIAIIALLGLVGLLFDNMHEAEIPASCRNMAKTKWNVDCSGNGEFAGSYLLLDGQKIDLNQASQTDLKQIPRISKRTVKAILEKRKRVGRFKGYDEVDKVKGVGKKTLERLKQYTKI